MPDHDLRDLGHDRREVKVDLKRHRLGYDVFGLAVDSEPPLGLSMLVFNCACACRSHGRPSE
jgi:hypothetical protein